jgi:UDP-N-acetylmuramyl pentapeptide phosphotransferase/UDP-N-acetylglucosamine-1-phosphate transferase
MTAGQAALVTVAAFAVGWAAVGALLPILRRRGVLDVPNRRSSHDVAVPRGGGLGLLAGFAVGLAVALALGMPMPGWGVLGGLAMMAGLGLYDDLAGNLSVGWRLLIQAAAAVLVIQGFGPLQRLPSPSPLDVELGVLGWPFSVLWVVGVVNIFNFLDGIDGFAGVQGIVAGLGLAVVGWGSWLGPAGFAAIGACLGFLVLNWHPAKIFMGDVGSLTLGFLFAVMPFGEGRGRAPLLVFVVALCMWFFLSDGAFTILRRILRRERVWRAHRSHLYQRLVIAGWSHSKVVLWVGTGMVAIAATGVGAAICGRPAALWFALALAVAASVVYWVGVVEAERAADKLPSIPDEGRHG